MPPFALRSTPALALLTVLAAAPAARAQSDAAAETLFRDGKRLLAEKRYDQACPKFAESARIAPSSGVELALGLCYEAQGKLASAWGAYTAVIPLARRDARSDREKVAAAHAKALEPALSRVTFTVDPQTAAVEGLELRQDGIVLGAAAWSDIPVDPGAHRVEVRAPGREPWSTNFTIGDSATVETLTVPPLRVAATVAPAGGAPGDRGAGHADAAGPWKTIGLVSGGVGLASVAVASIVGALALGKVSDAQKACPTSPCPNAVAVSENATGATMADASTGLFVTGGVLVAGGVLLYLFAPTQAAGAAPRASGGPLVGPGYLGWRGDF